MSTSHAIVQGSVRFAILSVLSYAVWAFGGRMSTITLYTTTALVFVALSGPLLYPLLPPPGRLRKLYAVFVPGFIAYAALWCVGWFVIRAAAGEILGSAAGLAAFTIIIVLILRPRASFLAIFAILFTFHTLGYTIGGMCYYAANGQGILAPLLETHIALGRLLWGFFHGLGFGAGLGFAFSQSRPQKRG
ncbi:MAG: hypothetical protein AAGD22_11680 [Verrucomicrobiota bacterium]